LYVRATAISSGIERLPEVEIPVRQIWRWTTRAGSITPLLAMRRGELRTDFREAQLFTSNTFQLTRQWSATSSLIQDDNTYTSRSGSVSQLKSGFSLLKTRCVRNRIEGREARSVIADHQEARFTKANSLFNGANSSPDPDHAQNSHATLPPSDVMRLSRGRRIPRLMSLRRVCAVRSF
jgi:hypothetical protein